MVMPPPRFGPGAMARLRPSLTMAIASRPPMRRAASSLPTIAQPSFWKSLIPKPLRKSNAGGEKKPRSKAWNPATFYIVIFLLIGSNAMRLIGIKRDFATFMRQSDTRIGLLREVVEKIQKGEVVDVEKALGTGVPQEEKDWEEVLREIGTEDITRPQKKQDRLKPPDITSTVKANTETGPSKSTAQFF